MLCAGPAYDYLRRRSLQRRNALSGTKLPMSQSQYGASVGGPIVANRTFYFTNVEQRRLDQSGLVTIAPANVEGDQRQSGCAGYQGPLLPPASTRIPSIRRTSWQGGSPGERPGSV